MSNGRTVANDGAVMHIDLRLVPLKKQVNLIWLSNVAKTTSELKEKTGISELYIKYILENKSVILKKWRESIQITKKDNLYEEDDHEAINILLLEWVKCCSQNKIVLYRYNIEMQANNLKDFFELPKYRIPNHTWQHINILKETYMKHVTTEEQKIPYDLYTILRTYGSKLLKLQTYVRFSKIMQRKANTDCINLLKKTHFEKKHTDDDSFKQYDDLILIEKPIECIDVTVEDDNLKNESLSPRSNTRSCNNTITTFITNPKSNVLTAEQNEKAKKDKIRRARNQQNFRDRIRSQTISIPTTNMHTGTGAEQNEKVKNDRIRRARNQQNLRDRIRSQSLLTSTTNMHAETGAEQNEKQKNYRIRKARNQQKYRDRIRSQTIPIPTTNMLAEADFQTTFDPKTSLAVTIKEEPCENMETDDIMEFPQVQIKNEILESSENIEAHGLSIEVKDIKTDMDIGEEFIQVPETTFIKSETTIKKEFENEIDKTETQLMKQTKTNYMGFEILEFENTLNGIENTKINNDNSKVIRQQKGRESNIQMNKVGVENKIIDNNCGISNIVSTNIKSEPLSKDNIDSSAILLTTCIKSEPDMLNNDGKLIEKDIHSDLEKTSNKNNNNSLTLKEATEFISGDSNLEDGDDDSEIEVIFEIEDSDEEMQSELQQIINNYRKKDRNKDHDKDKKQQQEQQTNNEEDTVTVLESTSESEDNANDDNIESNERTTEKRKLVENSSDSEESFNPNLPSTSRLAAVTAKIATSSSSSSLSSKAPVKKTPRLEQSSEEEDDPDTQIKIENNTDAIKYLQHIKNYLLSQNDEVGVKLLLNLQLAFINFN